MLHTVLDSLCAHCIFMIEFLHTMLHALHAML